MSEASAAPGVVPMPARPAPGARVVAFDFDGTLTRRDTLGPFLLQVCGPVGVALAGLRALPWLAAYALRLLDNERAKQRLLQAALAGRTVAGLEGEAERFVAGHLAGAWNPPVLERLRAHQAAGDHCVIVSASPGLYLRAVARHLGLGDALLCTELEADAQGRLTGRLATPNCHGVQKVARLRAWLGEPARQPLVDEAYGNSSGDHAMLTAAGRGWLNGRPWTAAAR